MRGCRALLPAEAVNISNVVKGTKGDSLAGERGLWRAVGIGVLLVKVSVSHMGGGICGAGWS